MSQNSFKTNVINRLLDINRNISENITDTNLAFNTISTALSAVSTTFSINNLFNSFSMDQLANVSTETTSFLNTTNSILNPIRVDKKLFERLNKLAEKVLKYCQCDRMKLVNSPPYIIDIIPDICQLLNMIQITYENKMHVLNDIEYFNILSRNLLDKLSKLVDLFKQSGKRIYDETNEERVRLTKYTLILSHMLAEMKSMFPKDVYEGQSFRIAKQDAADFWRQSFKDKSIVSWDDFEKKLNNVHKITNKMESVKLRRTVQLTESNYVSIFEFDIFTRLFQPWNNLLNNWKFLATEHPGYSAFSTYDEIHKRLQKFINKPGSYLYRLSCTKLGQWAIGYVTQDHKILQTIPQSLVQALIDGQKQNFYLYPNGSDVTIDISVAIEVTSATRIQISKEQYDMYCDMGTSFQLCKICSENNKDRKLEPCGHMICSSCLESWQDHNSTTPSCPFCRCEIKAFEPIIISPFENVTKQKSLTKRSASFDSTELVVEEIKDNLSQFNVQNDEMDGYLQRNSGYLRPLEKLSPLNSSKLNSIQASAISSSTSNSSVTNLIQIYEGSSKNTSPKGGSSSSSQDTDDSEYLVPNNLINRQSSTRSNNENIISNSISFNKKSNDSIKNSISEIHLSSLSDSNLRDISNSTRINSTSVINPQPPVFPPPLPPSNSNLAPPTIPPPMPPLNSNSSNKNRSNLVVKLNDSLDKNVIQIKIENSNLLDELTQKFGFDKVKVACALLIANNDINLAHDLLQKCSKN